MQPVPLTGVCTAGFVGILLLLGGCSSNSPSTGGGGAGDEPNPPDDPGTLPIEDEPPARTSVLDVENQDVVLSRVFGVLSGNVLAPSLADVPMEPGLYGTLVEPIPEPVDGSGETYVETRVCTLGGTVVRRFRLDTGNDFGELTFDACVVDELRFDGVVEYELLTREPRIVRGLDIALIDLPDTRITVAGQVQTGLSRSWFDEQINRSASDFSWSVVGSGDDWSISAANTAYHYGVHLVDERYAGALEGAFSLRMNALPNAELSISTPAGFVRDRPAFAADRVPAPPDGYTQGRLEIIADDGSSMTIEADPNDVTRFVLTLDRSDGTQMTRSEGWADWRASLTIDADRVASPAERPIEALAARLRTLAMR